ncbi:cysteine protease [Arthrobacter phage Mufasa8]|uniref:Cysteine protease n=1 Tax=Arthrobacter phage Mufasa8 TaxID=2656526 RepID=A0A649VN21_9CAUD|nr:peptidase [Arthrobacter phage Mufasa8]QGJ93475.1 cysteine protease [Arthrobacter phage Mufasa8]
MTEVRPLGRHVNHDPRSRAYQAVVAPTRKPVLHRHYGPVLDQGQLGSCTGNAMAQALNTAPFHKPRTRLLTEADAVAIYSAATALDSIPGHYPPEDTGSDGLSVAKAAKAKGYISSYTHAFSVEQALGALQLSPFLFGTSWHQSMFTPDAQGFVHPDGNVVGGHEILCIGDTGKELVFLNSWGKGWGLSGKFKLTYEDFAALMADSGDVTVPVK